MRPVVVREGWLLWQDWCQAAGLDPRGIARDGQLERFLAEVRVSDRHLAGLRTTAREHGLLGADDADPWAEVEQRFGFAQLEVCLRACPTAGWPAGYRGRRDAWLLVLTRQLRLTRAQAVSLSPTALSGGWRVGGNELPNARDTKACPRCVALRWLDLVRAEEDWGRSMVRQLLWREVKHPTTEHLCHSRDGLPRGLAAWMTLAPALDRHGWISGGYRRLNRHDPESPAVRQSMTPRALTTVLAQRCTGLDETPSQPQPVIETAPVEPPPLTSNRGSVPVDADMLDRIDEVCDRADQLNARLKALLEDTDAALRAARG